MPLNCTHAKASSKQMWEPMASSSAKSCPKPSTVPRLNNRLQPADGFSDQTGGGGVNSSVNSKGSDSKVCEHPPFIKQLLKDRSLQ
jgi:hypothetical protein